jgi:hypothetical protein
MACEGKGQREGIVVQNAFGEWTLQAARYGFPMVTRWYLPVRREGWLQPLTLSLDSLREVMTGMHREDMDKQSGNFPDS